MWRSTEKLLDYTVLVRKAETQHQIKGGREAGNLVIFIISHCDNKMRYFPDFFQNVLVVLWITQKNINEEVWL